MGVTQYAAKVIDNIINDVIILLMSQPSQHKIVRTTYAEIESNKKVD